MAQFGKVVHLEAVTRYQVGFQDSSKDLRVGGVSFFKKKMDITVIWRGYSGETG